MSEQSTPSGAVFLSYASQDTEAAARICETLRAAGIEVWFDQSELRGGDAWDSTIKKQIHDCALFIPLISANTNARTEGYFRREWNLATHRLLDMAHDAPFLVPVVIDGTRENHARVPEEFLRVHWTKMPSGDTPPAFTHRLRQMLDAKRGTEHAAQSTVAVNIAPRTHGGVAARRGRASRMWRVGVPFGALLLAFGAGIFWYYRGTTNAPVAQPTRTLESPSAPTEPNRKSIAVLPFVDMSPESNQEYMSDGIADELLNLLAQVPGLTVIARTSSFAFKNQNLEIADIARKLDVDHVVEGSVRKSGNKLRITAQLVRTADSAQLWSERYDRPLDDIFAVQEEIANAIAQALQIKLMGGTLSQREGGTQNLEVYQYYLKFVSARAQSASLTSLAAAQGYAEQAIKLDPNFGRAWFALANSYSMQAGNYLPDVETLERARQAVQHALTISPDLAEAHALLGYIYGVVDFDWEAASTELQRARAIDPKKREVLAFGGAVSGALGRWDDAERQYRGILEFDPLSIQTLTSLGRTYYYAGRFAESEALYRQALEIDQGNIYTRPNLGKVLLAQGQTEAALAMVQQAPEETRLLYLSVVLHAAGRHAEADEALKGLIAHSGHNRAFIVAQAYAHRSDNELALEWLERAHEQREIILVQGIIGEPLLRGIANDPRYKALLRKMNLPG